MVSRERVARLVDNLDHPDAIRQREHMDALVALGPDVIDPLCASLGLVAPRVKSALVRVLGELGDPRAILPLMRFVWDTREDIGAGDARGLAMKALAELASPEHAGRMTEFLLDIAQDHDPFVRGWAADALGRFGDRRAAPILTELVNDESPFVQERAQGALSHLDTTDSDTLKDATSAIDDDALLSKIRTERGGEQDFWLDELKSRDNAVDLAARLVQESGRGVIYGLQLLHQLGDESARRIARPLLSRSELHPDVLAIATRLVARFVFADMTDEEASAVRNLRYHEDRFVRLAALEAAAASGRHDLMNHALASLMSTEDADMAFSVARGLSGSVNESDRSWFPEISKAFKRVNVHRRRGSDARWIEAEAYLLRSLKNLVRGATLGTRKAQKMAFEALEGSIEHRPIVVTALELLWATIRENSDVFWPADHALLLVEVLEEYRDPATTRRALELLGTGAPRDLYSAVDILEDIAWRDDVDIASTVVPLLGRIGSKKALDVLNELANSEDDAIRIAAETALRQERNSRDVIDAEFEGPAEGA